MQRSYLQCDEHETVPRCKYPPRATESLKVEAYSARIKSANLNSTFVDPGTSDEQLFYVEWSESVVKKKSSSKMSHLRTKSKVLGDKTYKHVTGTGECRRNQFSLLIGRPQNIVHRLEHRFHEVTSLQSNITRMLAFHKYLVGQLSQYII